MTKSALSLTFIIAIISAVTFGAPKAQTTTATAATTTHTNQTLAVGATTPVFVNSGDMGAGVNIEGMYNAGENSSVYLGYNFGIHSWGKMNTNSSYMGAQIAPTLQYRWKANSNVTPYAAVAAGPYILFGADTKAYFMAMIKPGALFALTSKVSLQVEPAFGQMTEKFVFAPFAALNFQL